MWYSHSPAVDESIVTIRDGAVYQVTRNKERIKSNPQLEKVADDGWITKPITLGH